MSLSQFVGYGAGLFFHPFRTLSEIFEALKDQGKGSVLKFSMVSFLMGNTALITASMIPGEFETMNGAGFAVFHIAYSLVLAFMLNMMLIALFYMLLYFFSKETPRLDMLLCLYFLSDFLYLPMLPLAVILKGFLPFLPYLYGMIAFLLFLISVLMKIKALSLASAIGKGRSAVLYFMPIFLIMFFIILSAVYYMLYFSRVIF